MARWVRAKECDISGMLPVDNRWWRYLSGPTVDKPQTGITAGYLSDMEQTEFET
jgi:hypothetical protein